MGPQDRPQLPLVSPTQTMREAISAINDGLAGIALVVDAEHRLIATLTDGDIRRAILANTDLSAAISEVVTSKALSPYPHPISARLGTPEMELLSLMQERAIRQVPLLDDSGRVVDLVTLDDIMPQDLLPVQAVIMAGGLGTRLRPLTDETPKPMLPIGGRPLMELIVDQLRESGIRRVNVTTHFRPDTIADHFGDGHDFGVEIRYVEETQPLGTAGAVGLVEGTNEPILVINGDVLTRVNIREMLRYHQHQGADLTMAVRPFELPVPYGVVECDGPSVVRIREKPHLGLLVNAGVYLLQPDVVKSIPPGGRFDMTDLIQHLLENRRPVASFPIVEYWRDIGERKDYEQARKDFEGGRLGL